MTLKATSRPEAQAGRDPDAATQAVRAALAQLPPLRPTRDLVPEVLARIRQEAPATAGRFGLRSGPAPWRTWLPRLAALLAIVLGVDLAVRRHVERKQATRDRPSASATEARSVREDRESRTAKRLAQAWLTSHQDDEGRWDVAGLGGRAEHATALNALALMALMADLPPGSHATVRPGALALLAAQQPDGRLGSPGAFAMYEHGIATVALLRALERGAIAERESDVRRAVRFIRSAQTPAGGWGYEPHDRAAATGAQPNASVSAWQIEALGIARHLGWGDPEGHLRRGLFWITQLADAQGTVGYQAPSDYPSARLSTTAAGLFSLASAGRGLDGLEGVTSRMAQGLAGLLDQPGVASDANPYRDFFVLRAIAALPPPTCSIETRRILADVVQRVRQTQVQQGEHRGSWDPRDRYARLGGRLYSTSLSAMALP